MDVGIYPTPEPIPTESIVYSCSDQDSVLEVTVTNSDVPETLTYYWTYDGNDVQVGPDNTYIVPAGSDQIGEYFVTVIDERNCYGDTIITLVNGVTPQLENDTVFTKCINGETELSVNVLNADLLGSDLEYVWYVDGTEVQSGAESTFIHTPGLPLGFVEVVVVDLETTCEASILIEVVNGVIPQLENNTVFRKCMNEDKELSVNVLNTDLLGSDLEYVWYVDGTEVQSGSDYTYTHTAGLPLGFVEAVVIDLETMCEASTLIEVASFMNADCVDIPQGLSPNGDGMNDCLVLDHLEASDDIVKAEIYNRYGVKVFELNDYTSQWCGQDASSGNSNSNDLLPVGTYFYVIQFNSGRTPITSWIYLNY